MPFIRRKTLNKLLETTQEVKAIAYRWQRKATEEESRADNLLEEALVTDKFIRFLSENVEDFEGYVLEYMEKQENEDEVN